MNEPATIGDALMLGSQRLRDAGIGSADLEVALLLGMVTGFDRLGILTRTGMALTGEHRQKFDALLSRRLAHEPFQHLTGRQEFMSLEFTVGPAVLIPRPETEHLVEAVLDRIADSPCPPIGFWRGADIGTGSGAIAVSLTSYVHLLNMVATDVSKEALAIARTNADRHGVADRLEFRLGNALEPLAGAAGEFDFLVSNPPYIPTGDIAGLDPEVRDWEPRLALDGGADGMAILRILAEGGLAVLRPGGWLAVEVMAGQSEAVKRLLGGWVDLESVRDLAGHERVVIARRPDP